MLCLFRIEEILCLNRVQRYYYMLIKQKIFHFFAFFAKIVEYYFDIILQNPKKRVKIG